MTLVDSGMGAAPAAVSRPAARAASTSASAPPPPAPFSAAAAPAAGRPADAAPAAGTTGGAPGELQLPGGPQWSGLRRRVWQRSDRPGLPLVDALIVVEGEADARALGAAVSAPAYVLQGTRARSGPHASAELAALPALGLPIVVLTDPDEEGRSLRLLVDEAIGPVGHAFLPEAAALSEADDGRHAAGNRGVEHAAPAALAAALAAAAPSFGPTRRAYSREDLHAMGLMNKARARLLAGRFWLAALPHAARCSAARARLPPPLLPAAEPKTRRCLHPTRGPGEAGGRARGGAHAAEAHAPVRGAGARRLHRRAAAGRPEPLFLPRARRRGAGGGGRRRRRRRAAPHNRRACAISRHSRDGLGRGARRGGGNGDCGDGGGRGAGAAADGQHLSAHAGRQRDQDGAGRRGVRHI
jgi:5S rRNA maturation endonuclease (ribonuclease M5)